MENAVKLVSVSNGTMSLTSEGRFFLESRVGRKRCKVVIIAGPARSGKSTFLSRVSGLPFSIAHGSQPETKGLMINCDPEQSDTGDATLWIDVEGFGAPGNDERTDKNILALCQYICSVFICNTPKCITQSSITNLQIGGTIMDQLTSSFVTARESSFQVRKAVTSTLVVLIRDQHLNLQDERGMNTDASGHLESQINLIGSGAELIRNYHTERYCFVVPSPIFNADSKSPDHTVFPPTFLQRVDEVKQICVQSKSKFDGFALVQLISQFTNNANNMEVPLHQGVWESFKQAERQMKEDQQAAEMLLVFRALPILPPGEWERMLNEKCSAISVMPDSRLQHTIEQCRDLNLIRWNAVITASVQACHDDLRDDANGSIHSMRTNLQYRLDALTAMESRAALALKVIPLVSEYASAVVMEHEENLAHCQGEHAALISRTTNQTKERERILIADHHSQMTMVQKEFESKSIEREAEYQTKLTAMQAELEDQRSHMVNQHDLQTRLQFTQEALQALSTSDVESKNLNNELMYVRAEVSRLNERNQLDHKHAEDITIALTETEREVERLQSELGLLMERLQVNEKTLAARDVSLASLSQQLKEELISNSELTREMKQKSDTFSAKEEYYKKTHHDQELRRTHLESELQVSREWHPASRELKVVHSQNASLMTHIEELKRELLELQTQHTNLKQAEFLSRKRRKIP